MTVSNLATLELKNRLTETEQLCSCMQDLAASLALSKKTVFSVTLAMEELFTNIVSYGYNDDSEHVIKISIDQENDQLVVRIEDDGKPFDPREAESPDLKCPIEASKVGGLGIHLAKKMMDEVHYARLHEKNITTMKKKFERE